MDMSVEEANFNSIKVRLEHHIATDRQRPAATFQFHKGTIRTLVPLSLRRPTHISIP